MFTRFLPFVGAASAALLAASAAHAGAILVNGGFEGGVVSQSAGSDTNASVPMGWTADAGFISDSVNGGQTFSLLAHTGSGYLTIGNPDEEPTPLLSQAFNDVAGQKYQVTFWTLSQTAEEAPDPRGFLIAGVDNEHGDFDVKDTQDRLFTYHQDSFIFTGSKSGIDTLFIEARTDTGFFLVDDVSVTPLEGAGGVNPSGVPEPASWALMILGFGGIGAALRHRRTAFQPA